MGVKIILGWVFLVLNVKSSSHYDQNRIWHLVKETSTTKVFEYHMSTQQASEYFQNYKPNCISEGWMLCEYIRSAQVVFYKDGSAQVLQAEMPSFFKLNFPFTMEWKYKKRKNKVILDSPLILYSPSKEQLSWS